MSLFFLIAGFFARLLHQHLETRRLIKNQLKHLVLPLISFYFVALPLTVIAFIWGAHQLGIKGMEKMEMPFPVVGPPVRWGHLWFLYLLLVICMLVMAIRAVVVHLDKAGTLRSAIRRLLGSAFISHLYCLLRRSFYRS
jgi:fucose 4-O-acetylase-like acetyltransferase